MERLKPYSAYRDSGIPWLGKIPKHWEVWKVSHAFGVVGSGTTPKSGDADFYEGDTPWVTTSELREKTITETEAKVTSQALVQHPTLRVYPPATLLIAMYGATIGRLGILGIPACTNQACCAMANPKTLDTKLVFYWLQAYRDQIISLSSGGGQPNINQEDVRSLRIPAPSLPEQRAMAEFLDRETAQLDAFVTKKEQLIALLQERRSALISHAVTKGLNPDAPMRNSGIPWLGCIPTSWSFKRLGGVARLQRGFDLRTEDHKEGVYPVISSSGICGYHNVAMTKAPGVVTGRYGTIGEIYYIEQDFWAMNTALYVREFYGNNPRFIYYLLKILPFDAFQGKSAVPGIDRNDLHTLLVVEPPTTEQRAIADYLDRETSKIDALISRVRDGITALREYRTALISAVVSGKIAVDAKDGH